MYSVISYGIVNGNIVILLDKTEISIELLNEKWV